MLRFESKQQRKRNWTMHCDFTDDTLWGFLCFFTVKVPLLFFCSLKPRIFYSIRSHTKQNGERFYFVRSLWALTEVLVRWVQCSSHFCRNCFTGPEGSHDRKDFNVMIHITRQTGCRNSACAIVMLALFWTQWAFRLLRYYRVMGFQFLPDSELRLRLLFCCRA